MQLRVYIERAEKGLDAVGDVFVGRGEAIKGCSARGQPLGG